MATRTMRMVATPTGTLRVPRAQRPRGTVVPNALPKLPNMPWSEQKPKRDYRQNTPYDVYEVYAKVAEVRSMVGSHSYSPLACQSHRVAYCIAIFICMRLKLFPLYCVLGPS